MAITPRDRLFIERLAAIISEIEAQMCREQGYFIRPNASRVSNESVVEHVFILLSTGNPWSFLQYCTQPRGFHYQTVYQRFHMWVEFGIIEAAWTKVLERYVSSRLSKNATHFAHLYIDTTTVKNVGGTDCVGKNPTDRKRMGSKISAIVDDDKVSVSPPVPYPANRADITTAEPTFDSIPFDLMPDRRRVIKIAADKAYRSRPLFETMRAKRVRLVTEPKRNERNPIPLRRQDRSMFKKRIKIEHYFGISKKCRRIRTRFDGLMRHYVAFWYMSNVRRMMVVLSEKLSSTEFNELLPLID